MWACAATELRFATTRRIPTSAETIKVIGAHKKAIRNCVTIEPHYTSKNSYRDFGSREDL
jgi:hypothetical protein